MIKLISYLLAFYTIALSCIPCQDELLLPLPNPDHSEISAGKTDHSDETVVDLCSPFCICACCAAVTLLQAPAPLPENTVKSFEQPLLFSYKSDFSSGNLSVIWQPPRHIA